MKRFEFVTEAPLPTVDEINKRAGGMLRLLLNKNLKKYTRQNSIYGGLINHYGRIIYNALLLSGN